MSLSDPVIPNVFVNGATEVINATEVNANFDTLAAAQVASNAVINAATATKVNGTLVVRNSSGAAALDVTGNVTGNVTGDVTGNCSGNAGGTAVNSAGTGSIPLCRSENGLRIIRGEINGSDGAILKGTGFTSAKDATGTYTVTFTNAFSDVPTVVTDTLVASTTAAYTKLSVLGTAYFTVRLFISGSLSDAGAVTFIAIGPN
jgi:hypothetical protein